MLRDTFFVKTEPERADTLTLEVDKEAAGLELPVDLFRSGDCLIARAPIVGAALQHINVTLGQNRLTIQKTAAPDSFESPDRVYLQECHWDELVRTIELPLPVNPNATRATLTDGVLTITMPLINTQRSKLIRINKP